MKFFYFLMIFSCARQSQNYQVTFKRGGSFESWLSKEQGYSASILKIEHNDLFGRVLLKPETPKDLDLISQKAHAEGLGCGIVQPANFNLAGESLRPYVAPEFQPYIKLPILSAALEKVDPEKIKANVVVLENLGSRFHSSDTGLQTSEKIKALILQVAPTMDIQLLEDPTGTTKQKSVVASYKGNNDDAATIILGSHLDSIDPADLKNAPGADDNATGVANLIEVIRVINDSGLKFKKRIEFHFYAAEEIGLVGSRGIAQQYTAKNIISMMQLDMTGFAGQTSKIYLPIESTSSWLRRYLKHLAVNYLSEDLTEDHLVAGTSDHAAWNNVGVHAVFPFEHLQKYNPNLHTAEDKSSKLDFSYSTKFTKLALAHLAHFAGLIGPELGYSTDLKNFESALSKDTKVGVIKSSDKDFMVVATSEKIAQVESCVLALKTDLNCATQRFTFRLSNSQKGRKFFLSEQEIALAENTIQRFESYDVDGKLLMRRVVKFNHK